MKDFSSLDTWRFGANFIPSNAINQLEMWQSDTFDADIIRKELGWAAAIGMRVMRVYLHDLLFVQDADGFIQRMEKYLSIADELDIRTVFVFFDDCWKNDFALGRQPEPVPFCHNSGWIKSPGQQAASDIREYPRLKRYVQTVLRHFDGDKRILAWDLYNEPGNGENAGSHDRSQRQGKRSLQLLNAVFDWAQECDVSQPVTVGIWSWDPAMDELNDVAVERSEILSFHCYRTPLILHERIAVMRYLAKGRPVICTEYMARPSGSTFADCLPIMQNADITAINWGLVAGKTNTIYPWNWTADKGEPELYFHDVFHTDGTPLYPEEIEVFKKITAIP